MKVNIQGYKSYSFKDNNGNLVEGESIYFTYPDDYVTGLACEKLSVSLKKAVYPESLPAPAELHFKMRGKLDYIELL